MVEKKKLQLQWDDETMYNITLRRPVAYPPGSDNLLHPGMRIKMKGKAAKQIEDAIYDANPVTN